MNVVNTAMVLESAARQAPNKTFLITDKEQMTFGQLEAHAQQFANVLASLGVEPDQKVALLLPNEPIFYVCYFGILKLGAVVVPLNSSIPGPEVGYFLSDSEAVALIAAGSAAAAALEGFEAVESCQSVILTNLGEHDQCPAPAQRFETLMAAAAKTFMTERTRPENIANILYTSGVTGRPKGVILTHYNFYLITRFFVHDYPYLKSDSTALMVLPPAHVFGQVLFLGACFAQAALSLMPRFDPQIFLQRIERDKVTFFAGVPTIAHFLLHSPLVDQYDLTSLQLVYFGGSALHAEIAAQFKERFQVEVVVAYGITEAGAITLLAIDADAPPNSAGKAVWGTDLRIVDEEDNEVPTGEIGEIIANGPMRCQGYYNRPQETAHATRNGWFHTGDMGRVDANGYLFILDRLKDIINVGGYSVFPAEIERVLHTHPAVAEAAVIGLPDEVMGQFIKAVVVLKSEATATAEALITYCRSQLEAYKCPGLIEFRASIPKNPAGKILRRFLIEESEHPVSLPGSSSEILDTIREAPVDDYIPLLRNYLQTQAAGLVSQDASAINPQASLYALGLESLHLVMLKNQIKSDLLIEVPLEEIISEPNLAHLTAVVNTHLQQSDLATLEQTARNTPTSLKTFDPDVLENMTAEEARRTLTELADLTDEEVNTLLGKALDIKIEA
ncbi:MAG: AMP-binding protein [Chloroflexota bacterium]